MHKINWDIRQWVSLSSLLGLMAWFGIQLVLYSLPIGKSAYGPVLKEGRKLEYQLNGKLSLNIE